MKRLACMLGMLLCFLCTAAGMPGLGLPGLSGGTAEAAYSVDEEIQRFLACIEGKWVDANGHRGTRILSGYDGINNFRITNIRDWQGDERDGSAVITIMERRGSREMQVKYHREGSHSRLWLDNRLLLVPEMAEKQHAESVGGVHLDMTIMEMLKLYGPPAKALSEAETKAICGVEAYGWYYQQDGWLVTFDPSVNTVDRIFLLKGSKKYLDRVVLNADSPLERFAGLYGFAKVPARGDVMDLGHQEYLSFAGYPDYICLSIYSE